MTSRSPRAASDRVDIVIFGATGFTGRLVAQYFLRATDTTPLGRDGALTWAIAARDTDKLDTLKRSLQCQLERDGESAATAQATIDAVRVMVADGTDRGAMSRVVQSARVVLSVAGPYATCSALLVELCAQRGVHYCDLSAEMPWVTRNAATYDDTARTSGARIVHCCGFEAVPSDLMTFLLADRVPTPLSRVHFFWKISFGCASGGTVGAS